jgi:hypothetical protein
MRVRAMVALRERENESSEGLCRAGEERRESRGVGSPEQGKEEKRQILANRQETERRQGEEIRRGS